MSSFFFFFFFAIAYTFQNSLSTAFPQAKPKYIFCYYKHSNKIFVKSKLQLCCVVSNYNIKSCIHNVFATIHELLYLSQCFGTILSKGNDHNFPLPCSKYSSTSLLSWDLRPSDCPCCNKQSWLLWSSSDICVSSHSMLWYTNFKLGSAARKMWRLEALMNNP